MTRTFCSLCALSLIVLSACAAAPRSAPRTCFHDNEVFDTEVGYCQAVRAGPSHRERAGAS